MTFVVAEPCIACKFTDCVDVCPVDCFHEGKNFLVIDPDECIDCGACEPECPTTAIFAEDDLPEKWSEYTALNAQLTKGRSQGVTISRLTEVDMPKAEVVYEIAVAGLG